MTKVKLGVTNIGSCETTTCFLLLPHLVEVRWYCCDYDLHLKVRLRSHYLPYHGSQPNLLPVLQYREPATIINFVNICKSPFWSSYIHHDSYMDATLWSPDRKQRTDNSANIFIPARQWLFNTTRVFCCMSNPIVIFYACHGGGLFFF